MASWVGRCEHGKLRMAIFSEMRLLFCKEIYTCNLFKKIKTTHQENMGWALTNNTCNVCISMLFLDSWLIYPKTFWIFSHSNGWMPWIISIKLLKNVVKMFIIHNSHKIADFFFMEIFISLWFDICLKGAIMSQDFCWDR